MVDPGRRLLVLEHLLTVNSIPPMSFVGVLVQVGRLTTSAPRRRLRPPGLQGKLRESRIWVPTLSALPPTPLKQ